MEADQVEAIVSDLLSWSVAVSRRHTGTFAIYAGSDFNIEEAIDAACVKGVAVDYRQLANQVALQPVLAKRHYDETGSLRWFEIDIAPVHEAQDRVKTYKPAPGAAGLFLILVSANSETKQMAHREAKAAAELAGDRLVVVGWTRDSFRLREMAIELAAMEHVRGHHPQLEGDAIARRELDARIARVAADLDDKLAEALGRVDWELPAEAEVAEIGSLRGAAALSQLASRLADWRYPATPKVLNELVNRTRPSSNANAASRTLLRAMVENSSQSRLGIDGFPPEAGLYESLLGATGLHAETEDGQFGFRQPQSGDSHGLTPIWETANSALASHPEGCTIAELFDLWRGPPIGARDGLLPIFAIAYLMSRADGLATYLEGTFRPQLDSFLVDRMLQEPESVRARLVELTDLDTALVSDLATRLSGPDISVAPEALEVARAIVRKVRALPHWTLRTSKLSGGAAALRDLGKHSTDPNQLLFKDIPDQVGDGKLRGRQLAEAVERAIVELEGAYPLLLRELAGTLFTELRLQPHEAGDFRLLKGRAENVKGLSGNFRLDALATRLIDFTGEPGDIEGIATLAANKPARDWVDRDVDAARVELAALAQQFLRAEGLAHLKGREDGRISMAVYVSDPSFPAPASPHFELTAIERDQAAGLAVKLEALLSKSGAAPNVALGAVATLGLSLAEGFQDAGTDAVEAQQ